MKAPTAILHKSNLKHKKGFPKRAYELTVNVMHKHTGITNFFLSGSSVFDNIASSAGKGFHVTKDTTKTFISCLSGNWSF